MILKIRLINDQGQPPTGALYSNRPNGGLLDVKFNEFGIHDYPQSDKLPYRGFSTLQIFRHLEVN